MPIAASNGETYDDYFEYYSHAVLGVPRASDNTAEAKGSSRYPDTSYHSENQELGSSPSTEIPHIDRSHDVPLGAAALDKGDGVSYGTAVDRRVPHAVTIDGVTFDPAVPVHAHEQAEHPHMERILISKAPNPDTGKPYTELEAYHKAHDESGTPADKEWIYNLAKENGRDPEEFFKTYQSLWSNWVKQAQAQDPELVHPHTYTKPYDDPQVAHLRDTMEDLKKKADQESMTHKEFKDPNKLMFEVANIIATNFPGVYEARELVDNLKKSYEAEARGEHDPAALTKVTGALLGRVVKSPEGLGIFGGRLFGGGRRINPSDAAEQYHDIYEQQGWQAANEFSDRYSANASQRDIRSFENHLQRVNNERRQADFHRRFGDATPEQLAERQLQLQELGRYPEAARTAHEIEDLSPTEEFYDQYLNHIDRLSQQSGERRFRNMFGESTPQQAAEKYDAMVRAGNQREADHLHRTADVTANSDWYDSFEEHIQRLEQENPYPHQPYVGGPLGDFIEEGRQEMGPPRDPLEQRPFNPDAPESLSPLEQQALDNLISQSQRPYTYRPAGPGEPRTTRPIPSWAISEQEMARRQIPAQAQSAFERQVLNQIEQEQRRQAMEEAELRASRQTTGGGVVKSDKPLGTNFKIEVLGKSKDPYSLSGKYKESFAIKNEEGKMVATGGITIEGDHGYVDHMYSDIGHSHVLGVSGMKQLIREFKRIHPEVKSLSATRVTGARHGPGQDTLRRTPKLDIKLK